MNALENMKIDAENSIVKHLENFLNSKLDYNTIRLVESSKREKFHHLYDSIIHRIKKGRKLSHIDGLFYELIDPGLNQNLGYARLRQWECKKSLGENPTHVGITVKIDSIVSINHQMLDGLIVSYLITDTACANMCHQEKFTTKDINRRYNSLDSLEGMTCRDFVDYK